MSGKGDKPRPVDKKEYDANFERIFGPYKSPRERRIEELETDLKGCQEALGTMNETDPDRPKLLKIIDLIEQELKDT